MTPNWQPLHHEFAQWRASGLRLPVWWRDDDAITVTPQLNQLVDLSERIGLPVHLAVIPRDADAKLAERVLGTPALIPVVHGWAHQNHAPQGEKKAEFRAHRPVSACIKDAATGLSRLRGMFGQQLVPMFVPPWNRIAPDVSNRLADVGYTMLSTATPRATREQAPGLEQINTHLDPIDWRGTRGVIDPDLLVTRTAELLKDRREGRADNTEPFGILTHHLVHDPDIWSFTQALLDTLLDGPGYAWEGPDPKPTRSP